MKIAYFDCFAGASGDMILGSLLDAGLELEKLNFEIAKLGLSNCDIQVKKVVKRGIGGSQAIVRINSPSIHDHDHDQNHEHNHSHHHPHHHPHHHDHHGHTHAHEHHSHSHSHEPDSHDHHCHQHGSIPRRNLHDIRHLIKDSQLADVVKEKSINIFERLAEAEAKVHRIGIEDVHFHEVGAVDAIIDVVGAVAGMELMGIGAVYCSPLHVGTGTVECDHGTLPVPAPATLELICGKPAYSTGVVGELLTPTGAAILTTLATDFGPMPKMVVEQVGYGSGEKDLIISNLLRISIGVTDIDMEGYETERVGVLETNIDDMNPQIYDYLMEKLLSMGVMDVFLLPVQMKKNRPATLVRVLCSIEMINKTADFLLRETTSIGLRWHIEDRIKTQRKIKQVQTPYGPIHYKVASLKNGELLNVFPEYEDCKAVAREKGIPLKKVMETTVEAALKTEKNKIS